MRGERRRREKEKAKRGRKIKKNYNLFFQKKKEREKGRNFFDYSWHLFGTTISQLYVPAIPLVYAIPRILWYISLPQLYMLFACTDQEARMCMLRCCRF